MFVRLPNLIPNLNFRIAIAPRRQASLEPKDTKEPSESGGQSPFHHGKLVPTAAPDELALRGSMRRYEV